MVEGFRLCRQRDAPALVMAIASNVEGFRLRKIVSDSPPGAARRVAGVQGEKLSLHPMPRLGAFQGVKAGAASRSRKREP